jgi:serine/threonine protein kinase
MDERTNALPVGTELEGYRVVALLGAGGFGITYKAVDLLLDRPVAIKEYLPSVLASRGADRKTVQAFGRQEQEQFAWGLERFRSEARTLVAFQHSHIVPVHRYFEANGTGYLVMAFQDGKSLADVIDAVGTLSEDELLTILRPLATGLADVHAKGFLHRDIKPANIIIRRDGTPVLIDFGAARQAVTRQSRGLTAIVTEGYAPYEQYETDSHQGPWTDIYALGAVLYHCVTGKRPPEAPKRIAAQLRKQPDPMVPALIAAGDNYSESLLVAIDCALEVEEAKRPQDVHEFMALVDSRGAPGAAPKPAPGEAPDADAGAAEAFMVEAPSVVVARPRPPSKPGPADPDSASVVGNVMIEAPSAPQGRRRIKVAPPAQPLIARSRSPEPAAKPESRAPAGPAAPPGDANATPSEAEGAPESLHEGEPEGASPAPSGNTLMVGGATLIVGDDREPSSAAIATEPRREAEEAEPSLAALSQRKRRTMQLVFGSIAVVALGGVAVAYFAQKQGSAPTPPPMAQPKPETAPPASPPAAPKLSEEDLARSRSGPPTERVWLRHVPKNGQDVVRRVFVLPNDQLLIAGGRLEAGANFSDAWLWRFDAKTGQPLGDRKSFSNARVESGNAVIHLGDGATVIAAARRDASNNSIVAWVVRIAPDGEQAQWEQTFGNRTLTIPYAVTALPNGDIVVVGTAAQSDKGTQGWAARISAKGKVVWEKLYGEPGDDNLQAVAALLDGGIIAVGSANVVRPNADDSNLWILNLDAEGNVRGQKRDLGDDADERGKAVAVAEDGDIVVLAETSRVPPKPARPAQPARPGQPGRQPEVDLPPVNKPWILRLSPDLQTVRWTKPYTAGKDDKHDWLDAIASSGDGGFVLAGTTESRGAGKKDGWLLRIDGAGNQLWDKSYGEQFDDEFTAVAVLPDGGVIVGGSAQVKGEQPPPATRPPVPPRPGLKGDAGADEAKIWLERLGYTK